MFIQKRPDKTFIEINDLRQKMIASGIAKGLNNSETLYYSEELDKLIIQAQMQDKSIYG